MNNLIKLCLYYILTIQISYASLAQTTVSGIVVRQENDLPLKGANIVLTGLDGKTFGTVTDDDGSFSIDNILSGEYNVFISFIGFKDYNQIITIEDGKIYTVNATLSIQPITMTKLEIISDADSKFNNLPGASTVLQMETIKLLNPIGTQEMLEYVPGVNGYADDGIGNS